MYIYCSDEMATKVSDLSKYQATTCSLLDLSSLAITTSVIVPMPYIRIAQPPTDQLHGAEQYGPSTTTFYLTPVRKRERHHFGISRRSVWTEQNTVPPEGLSGGGSST
jgi:hypothetical protein